MGMADVVRRSRMNNEIYDLEKENEQMEKENIKLQEENKQLKKELAGKETI